MASMFDVSTTMSQVAEQQAQEMGALQNQVDTISEKVDGLKVNFDNSLISIDTSIDAIVNTTDRIMFVTQNAIEEQQIQTQILESEQEVEQLKGAEKKNSSQDPTFLLRSMEEKIKLMQFNVEKLLEENSKYKSNIPNIGSSTRKALGVALGTIFGASVLGYLFSDEANPEEKSAETKQDSASETPAAEQQAESETDGSVEQAPQAEPPGDGEIETGGSVEQAPLPQNKEPPKTEEASGSLEPAPIQEPPKPEEEKVSKIEPTEDMAGKITKAENAVVLRERAMSSGELIKTDDAYYYPDGKVVDLRTSFGASPKGPGLIPEQEAKLLEVDAEIYTKSIMDDTEENRKEFPGLWDDKKVTADKPSTGDNLMKSNEKIEKSDYQVRSNIAQNMITVINQPDSAPEPSKKKTPTVIGKVTYEQIVG
jgi:hypothetical protein